MLYKFLVKSESIRTKGLTVTKSVIISSANVVSAKNSIKKHTPGKIKSIELIGSDKKMITQRPKL